MEQFLTINEVCALLRISRDTVYRRFVNAKEIPIYRVGEHIRFKSSDVEAYVERGKAS